jgi:DNA-binding response OmpR family regulator
MLATLERPNGGVLALGVLEVDLDAYAARLDGAALDLTSSEIELLALLISNNRRVVDRKQLAEAIGLRQQRSVDVLLSSLRHKTGRDFLRNVRGRGWIIDAEKLD